MEKWRKICIPPKTTIIRTMEIIDKTTLQFAVVVDNENHLLGTVTDGDIRRGILKGLSLESPIHEVMNPYPIYAYKDELPSHYKDMLKQSHLNQLPIVDNEKRVCYILFSGEINEVASKENLVVLMAGGLGTRLRPLTNDMPKPMLNIGDKPILETIIESFKSYGFSNFIITVNYKKEIIKEYFKDGSYFGVNISYIDEDKRLGTAGALSLMKHIPTLPFFVMNADLLTKMNYEQMLFFHNETNSMATMCVREYEYQIPYGVIKTENHKLLGIEKNNQSKKLC
nr:sugar phosphate nucleotidyltransferase [Heyndrickxia oleronia]